MKSVSEILNDYAGLLEQKLPASSVFQGSCFGPIEAVKEERETFVVVEPSGEAEEVISKNFSYRVPIRVRVREQVEGRAPDEIRISQGLIGDAVAAANVAFEGDHGSYFVYAVIRSSMDLINEDFAWLAEFNMTIYIQH